MFKPTNLLLFLIIIFTCAPALAVEKEENLDLGLAVTTLVNKLNQQENLHGHKVFVSANHFYETRDGNSPPLALLLKEKTIAALTHLKITVVAPGGGLSKESYMIQGKWYQDGGFLSLTYNVKNFNASGDHILAMANIKIHVDHIPEYLMRVDSDSIARHLVRKLDQSLNTNDFSPGEENTVHLRPFILSQGQGTSKLAQYLV